MEVKTVDHQADVTTVHLLNYFIGQLQCLHTAILLTQELESQSDAMPLSYRRQLSEYTHGLFDHFIAAQATGRKFAGNNHNIGTADRGGHRAQLFALPLDSGVCSGISKGDIFD